MTLQPAALKTPVAVVGDQADCLTEIFRNEVNLAVWNRALRPEVTRFAEALTVGAGQLERFVCLTDGDSAATALPNWALDMGGALFTGLLHPETTHDWSWRWTGFDFAQKCNVITFLKNDDKKTTCP